MKTRREIRQALKVCAYIPSACTICPYNVPDQSYDECMTLLIRDAKGLIDSLMEAKHEKDTNAV